MKTFTLALALVFTSTVAFAQGKVQFGNDSLHLVYFTPNSSLLLPADVSLAGDGLTSAPTPSGITFAADLFAGTSSAFLTLQSTTTFQATVGRFNLMSVVLTSIPGGSTAYFQVQIRDSNDPPGGPLPGSYFGESPIFTAVPGASVYNSLVLPESPGNSTWAPGTFDMSAQYGLEGARGAIEVGGVIPEPSGFALAAIGLVGLLVYRKSV